MNKKLEFFSSMAVAFIVLILVFLCIRFSGQGKFATHGGTNPSDVKCIYTSVWPDNEYTRLICEPESGTIEYILDGSNAGYYAKYSLQGTTQGRYLTGGVPPVRFSM